VHTQPQMQVNVCYTDGVSTNWLQQQSTPESTKCQKLKMSALSGQLNIKGPN